MHLNRPKIGCCGVNSNSDLHPPALPVGKLKQDLNLRGGDAIESHVLDPLDSSEYGE